MAPADLEARVWDRFDHAGTERLKVLMADARHAELPPAVRDRLRLAYPGQYITDVPEGELALL